MAATPYFTGKLFNNMTDITANTKTVVYTGGEDDMEITAISLNNPLTSPQPVSVFLGDLLFAETIVSARAGHVNSGVSVPRFELFSENIFPQMFSTTGVGRLPVSTGETISIQFTSGTGSFNASVSGAAT